MIRGTTPRHTFTLPFAPPEGSEYRIVYAQGEDHYEKILFELTKERITVSDNVLSVNLKDEETLLFDCTPHRCGCKLIPYPVKVQIGVKTPNGKKLWSNIIETTVERCLRKDGVV